MEQKKIREVSVSGKERLCDSSAHIDSDEKDIGAVFGETGQHFTFAAAEVQPYVALSCRDVRLKPIVNADRNSALERIRMPPNSIAHMA
jgi:hypothetical protein